MKTSISEMVWVVSHDCVSVSQMSREKGVFWALVWGCGSGLGDQMVQGLSRETDGAGKLTPVCRSDQEQYNLWMKWWSDQQMNSGLNELNFLLMARNWQKRISVASNARRYRRWITDRRMDQSD